MMSWSVEHSQWTQHSLWVHALALLDQISQIAYWMVKKALWPSGTAFQSFWPAQFCFEWFCWMSYLLQMFRCIAASISSCPRMRNIWQVNLSLEVFLCTWIDVYMVGHSSNYSCTYQSAYVSPLVRRIKLMKTSMLPKLAKISMKIYLFYTIWHLLYVSVWCRSHSVTSPRRRQSPLAHSSVEFEKGHLSHRSVQGRPSLQIHLR